MTRQNDSRLAPEGASGTGRDRRLQGGRTGEWVRPLLRMTRALEAAERLIDTTLRTQARSARCAHQRPIGTSRDLNDTASLLITASVRLERAVQRFHETLECIGQEAELPADAPELILRVTERWIFVAAMLSRVANDVFSLHMDVLEGLRSGELRAECNAFGRRPRIVLAPRPIPIRTYLARRQSRVVDRIASVLRRRRRTPRPAALRVPQRSTLGRAPPLSPVCPI